MLKHVVIYYDNGAVYQEYYVDSSRMKQGEHKEYYENGKPEIICNYVNNKLHGECKSYYHYGKLYKHTFFLMDKEVDVSIHGMDINNLTEDDMNLLRVIYA